MNECDYSLRDVGMVLLLQLCLLYAACPSCNCRIDLAAIMVGDERERERTNLKDFYVDLNSLVLISYCSAECLAGFWETKRRYCRRLEMNRKC